MFTKNDRLIIQPKPRRRVNDYKTLVANVKKAAEWVIVTGASSGIGRACVDILVANEFHVLATAREEEDIAALNTLENTMAIYLELTDAQSISALRTHIREKDLNIVALVNNAGILYMDLILTTPPKQIQQLLEVNVLGTVRLCQAVIEFLIASKGTIITISSDSGLVTFPYTTAYSMSKHALEAFCDGLRVELSSHEVDVVAIEPGNVQTEIAEKAWKVREQIETSVSDQVTQSEIFPIIEVLHSQRQSIRDLLRENKEISGIKPEKVAQVVLTSITTDNPRSRYFVGSKEELNYVINELVEQIIQINASTDIPLTDDELREKIEFGLNL